MIVYPAPPLLMEIQVDSFYHYRQHCRKHSCSAYGIGNLIFVGSSLDMDLLDQNLHTFVALIDMSNPFL